jgi:hypothetical protein
MAIELSLPSSIDFNDSNLGLKPWLKTELGLDCYRTGDSSCTVFKSACRRVWLKSKDRERLEQAFPGIKVIEDN